MWYNFPAMLLTPKYKGKEKSAGRIYEIGACVYMNTAENNGGGINKAEVCYRAAILKSMGKIHLKMQQNTLENFQGESFGMAHAPIDHKPESIALHDKKTTRV